MCVKIQLIFFLEIVFYNLSELVLVLIAFLVDSFGSSMYKISHLQKEIVYFLSHLDTFSFS